MSAGAVRLKAIVPVRAVKLAMEVVVWLLTTLRCYHVALVAFDTYRLIAPCKTHEHYHGYR